MKCKDIMKMNVECVTPQDDCQTAARRMRDRNVGFLPCCDDDMKPLGTLTDRDLAIRVCADDLQASACRIEEVMSTEVVTCGPEDDLSVAEDLMSKHQKSRIMVVEDEKLIGVISLSDIAEREPPEKAAETLKNVASREVRA
jgi:predicted transcriptional regulator